jgi:hypothetical protein
VRKLQIKPIDIVFVGGNNLARGPLAEHLWRLGLILRFRLNGAAKCSLHLAALDYATVLELWIVLVLWELVLAQEVIRI